MVLRLAAKLRGLWRRLTRVEVTRPEERPTSAATDPEMLKNVPPGGVGPS